MNEKIIELAKEAGIHPANFEPDADLSGPLKKFAELIVRECAEVTDEWVRQGDIDIPVIIKRHFGVE